MGNRSTNRSTIRKYFCWPDTHAPYHDETAVNVALAAVHAFEPDELIVLGDLWDFYACSFYTKDPRRKHLVADELEDSDPVVDAIKRLGCYTVFLKGNHEQRLERSVRERAPELHGLVKTVKQLIPDTWKYVPYGTSYEAGRVLYSHDFGRSGDLAPRQGLVDVGANIVFGHTHQLSFTTLGQQRGKAHAGMSCGWLGGLKHIDYRHAAVAKRKYQHGFGIVHECTETRNVWMTPVPIIITGRHGECVIEGKRVRV